MARTVQPCLSIGLALCAVGGERAECFVFVDKGQGAGGMGVSMGLLCSSIEHEGV